MRKICCLFILISFISCNKQQKDARFERFPETIQIKGKQIGTTQKFKATSIVGIIDSILIINPGMNDHVFYLFNSNNFKLLARAGNTGRGPYELPGGTGRDGASLNKTKRLIYASNRAKGKIFCFSIDSILNNKNYQPEVYMDIPKELALISEIEMVNDSLFLSRGIIGYSLFLINKQGKILEKIGHLPDKPENIKAVHYNNLFNNHFTYSTLHKQIAIGFSTQDKLISYNLEGKKLFERIGPDFIEANYKNQYDGSTKTAYWSLEADSQYIYGLYAGERRYRLPSEASNLTEIQTFHPKSIQIFNWEGQPQLKIQLDKRASDFIIDKKTNRLITLSQSKKPFTVYDFSIIQKNL